MPDILIPDGLPADIVAALKKALAGAYPDPTKAPASYLAQGCLTDADRIDYETEIRIACVQALPGTIAAAHQCADIRVNDPPKLLALLIAEALAPQARALET